MTTLKGKDLDDFFKNQLSKADIPYDEANWLRLEKQLKRNNRKPAVSWITISGIAAAVLLTLSISYFFYSKSENKQQLTATKARSENTTNPVSRQPSEDRSISKNNELTEAVISNPIADRVREGAISGKKMEPEYSATIAPVISSQIPANPAPEKLLSRATVETTDSAGFVSQSPSENVITTPILAENSPAISGSTKRDSAIREIEEPVWAASRFTLSLVAGPDINGVSSLKTNRGGISAGITATYKFAKAFGITTGAVYAKKLYDSEFEYYNPNSTYKFPVPPKLVTADCRVLDIPLNISYTAWSKSKNAFEVSAGISSYLMLNEQYSFSYENPASKGPKTYYITNKNQHYLGILNFALGYKRQVSNELSIGMQPYLKLPVTDIGYGNVKLLSTGIVTSVHLNLPRKGK